MSSDDGSSRIIPSHLRNLTELSGPGAVVSVKYTATRSIRLITETANIAGKLVCEEVGTAPIDRQKLLTECKTLIEYRSFQ